MDAFLRSIRRISNQRTPPDTESLAALESSLGVLPRGYAAFVSEFGEGMLTSWVRVYPPERVARERDAWRTRIREYWFWDDDAETGLDQRRALACDCIGDTLGGDELVVHPEAPDSLYVLPRHANRVRIAGTTLGEALAWLHRCDLLASPLETPYFEPWVDRLRLDAAGTGAEHDAIVRALEASGLVTERIDASEEEQAEDGPFTTLLLPSIGGIVTVADASAVTLRCDPDAAARSLKRVEDALRSEQCAVGGRVLEPAPRGRV